MCYFFNSKPCNANSNYVTKELICYGLMWQSVMLQSRVQPYLGGRKVGSYHFWNPSLVTRLVGFWGCAQSNASGTCVCLRLAGCEGLHLFLGNAPQNGIWSAHKFQANASSLKPHSQSPLRVLKSRWAAELCAVPLHPCPGGPCLSGFAFGQQLPPAIQQLKCWCSFGFGALLRAVCSMACLVWLDGFPAVQVALWLQATDLAQCTQLTHSTSLLCSFTREGTRLPPCQPSSSAVPLAFERYKLPFRGQP